jgi:DNA helicase-2/ATP-dependent DNA helicase PcrA
MSREYVLEPFRAPIELDIDYAGELNEQQYAAVTAVPSPALVIAGAGSGKTRTLTYRVAYLLEQGVPPDRILLLTFTNKAAREMMRRVSDLLRGDLSSLWGGTFHSIGNRILRLHAERLGYTPGFTILDREDTEDLLKVCISDANIDLKETRFPKAEVISEVFSLAVNTQQTLAQMLKERFNYFELLEAQLRDLLQRFAARKQAANVMDFDDLLVLWLRLLREHADLCERYQRRFQFILVDEYQDTNKLQSDLIDLLAARHQNVMVVGDDSQSIYSWRGANFHNILQFPNRYPKAAIYKIEINYRSTPEILALANAAIAPNRQQFAKALTAARKSGMKPVLVPCGDGAEQARFVAQRALQLRDEGIELRDMAVLYRSHFHALELQLELTRRNIPFTITSGIRFFEQAHIKDVAAYLKFINNPQDELSFKRLAGLLPGIGGKSADKLWLAFRARLKVGQASSLPASAVRGVEADDRGSVISNRSSVISGLPLKSTIRDPQSAIDGSALPALAMALQACGSNVPKKTAAAWAQFTTTIAQLESEPVRSHASQMIQLILEASYEEYLQEYYPNYRARLEDLEQLATYAMQFKTTEEFLSQLALLSNLEVEEDRPATSDDERIRLSTVHQAKGLEFSVVFIIMLCEGLFPAARSIEEEEERRLFYVALTRAKNELYLTYPLIRVTGGYTGDIMQQPSRFLSDIPDELIDEWSLSSFNPYGT